MIDVERSPEPPASLAEKKSWRGDDVLERLHADFLGKCYLTEAPVPNGGFEVDHRRPRGDGGNPFDWWNVYPCHHDANGRREKKWPEGGLLHPDGRDRVESRLVQELELEPSDVFCRFCAVEAKDIAAVNTARELDRLHNGNGKGGAKARALRDEISRRLIEMLKLEGDVRCARLELPETALERRTLEQKYRRFVSREQPFTALLRSQAHPSLRDLFD